MAEYLKPDLCIIGAGAGGLAAAKAARALGASVILVERGNIGGDLNLGTVPSKALLAAARRAHWLRTAAAFGMTNAEPKPNFRAVQEHVQDIIATMASDESVERLTALGIDIIPAEAKFVDGRTLQAGDALIRARRFIIATGSRPAVPVIAGLDAVPFFTSDTIFDNIKKLTHLLIIGGGPLGIELAQGFRRLGAQVSVVETGAALAACDPELVNIALRRLREEGVVIREHSKVGEIIARGLGTGVRVQNPDGSEDNLDVSHILVATGRVPNLEGLDLAAARIKPDPASPTRLALRGGFRTSNFRVYALGDAAKAHQQVLGAQEQAELAVRRALFGPAGRRAAPPVPRAIYCDPEIAEVGMGEAEARRRLQANFRVVRWPFGENLRARATRQTYGVAKLICRRDGRILGAGIVGPDAGELIALFSFAMANGMSAQHLQAFVAPHPSLAEVAHRLGAQYFADAPQPWWAGPLQAITRRLP